MRSLGGREYISVSRGNPRKVSTRGVESLPSKHQQLNVSDSEGVGSSWKTELGFTQGPFQTTENGASRYLHIEPKVRAVELELDIHD
jgi:hypothetical protein